MKSTIILLIILFSSNMFSQELKTIIPSIDEAFNFGIEVQNDWKKRRQLLDDLYTEKKSWENLSNQEKELLEKYDETFESIWDVEGGGCSWYCGAGDYNVTTSSELQSNGNLNYKSQNLTDFSYQTAWVEGEKGYGIGEFIEFSFSPTHPRITTIIIANGYVKSKKAWKDNSRVHELKMYLNNKAYAIIKLEDVYAKQYISLDKPLGFSEREGFEKLKEKENWNIKFEIISVYKGDKYEDTAISEIYFDGIDVHCLAKGTLITMGDKSLKKIEQLNIGDEVLSFNENTQEYEISVIQKLASPFHKNLIKIEFSNGTNITCTKDHPFLSSTSKWTSFNPSKTENDYEINDVTNLKLGSKLKAINEIIEVVKITEIDLKRRTYTIVELDKNMSFIANGIVTAIEKLRVPTQCIIHCF